MTPDTDEDAPWRIELRVGVHGLVGDPGRDVYCGDSVETGNGGIAGALPMLEPGRELGRDICTLEFWRGRKAANRGADPLVGEGFALETA